MIWSMTGPVFLSKTIPQPADLAPRGDQIGSPKLHGRHQRPEESAVFCWKKWVADSWQWWKIDGWMAGWLPAESWKNSHPITPEFFVQSFSSTKQWHQVFPSNKIINKTTCFGCPEPWFSIKQLSHELVKFGKKHLPTNLKLDIFH